MTGFLHAVLMEKILRLEGSCAFVCPHLGHKPINMGAASKLIGCKRLNPGYISAATVLEKGPSLGEWTRLHDHSEKVWIRRSYPNVEVSIEGCMRWQPWP